MFRFLLILLVIWMIYKIIAYVYKEWQKEDIHEGIDKKKEVMAETIKAAQKVDKDEMKAYEKAEKKLEEFK